MILGIEMYKYYHFKPIYLVTGVISLTAVFLCMKWCHSSFEDFLSFISNSTTSFHWQNVAIGSDDPDCFFSQSSKFGISLNSILDHDSNVWWKVCHNWISSTINIKLISFFLKKFLYLLNWIFEYIIQPQFFNIRIDFLFSNLYDDCQELQNDA